MEEGQLVGAVPSHGDKQRASILFCAAVAAATAGVLGRWGRGEIRASDDAQLDARIDEQRKTNGVLPAAQKALCPVDRIERPHACEKKKEIKNRPSQQEKERNARPVRRPPAYLPLSMARKSVSAPHRLPRPHSARSSHPVSASASESLLLDEERRVVEVESGGCARTSSASSTTRARSASLSFSFVVGDEDKDEDARRSEASSSPTMGSSGKAFERTMLMTACAA